MDQDPHEMDQRRRQDRRARQDWDALRSAMDGHAAPPAVEQALLQALARKQRPLPWQRRWLQAARQALAAAAGRPLAGLGAAACVLALTLAALHQGGMPDAALPGAPGAMLAQQDATPQFIALETAERIRQDPAPQLVQADVPRNVLAQLGLPVALDGANDDIRAEMLIGADGSPLAMRLMLN